MIEVKPVHRHFPVGSRDSGEALFELLAEHLAVRKMNETNLDESRISDAPVLHSAE